MTSITEISGRAGGAEAVWISRYCFTAKYTARFQREVNDIHFDNIQIEAAIFRFPLIRGIPDAETEEARSQLKPLTIILPLWEECETWQDFVWLLELCKRSFTKSMGTWT